jgi:hypothetical protein
VRCTARAWYALVLVVGVLFAARPALAHILDHGKTVVLQNVYVPPNETIDGDLNVIFGNAEIAGHVRGDVNTIFGRCTKVEGAVIDGQENCIVSDADDGMRAFLPWMMNSNAWASFARQDRELKWKLGSSAIVLLVFLIFPMRMRMALDRVERNPGLAAGVGTVAMLAVVPVALLLLISIVGIPLIALEAAAVLAGVWLGTGAVALLVGRRLAELLWPNATPSPLWALILGLVVVCAAETVPVVGWAVTALVWLVGLGASILAFLAPPWVERIRTTIGGPPMRSA